MVVMTTPDLNSYHIKRSYVRKDVEYVYVDHGPTSVHMCYRKGAFDHFDTVMCNGPFQVAEHRATEALYKLKPKKLVESGYPLLDTLKAGSVGERRNGLPRVMIANSHQKDNVFDTCLDELIASIAKAIPAVQIVVRPHPQYVRRNPARWQAIKDNLSGPHAPASASCEIIVEDDFSQPSTMDKSDVLVTDWSGIAYEFAYKTRRPTLFVDTPMKVINPEWKKIGLVPTDISFRNEVGVSVATEAVGEKAGEAVAEMLANPDRFAAKIDNLFRTQFFNAGHAGEVAGEYILNALLAKRSTRK